MSMSDGIIVTNVARPWVKKHEGLRLKTYTCSAGKLTIGYGRNLDDKGITELEAEYLLEGDLRDAYFAASSLLGDAWHKLSDNRKAVLVDMAVNLGKSRLSGFKNMLARLKEGKYEAAAAEMKNSRWATQVGVRAEFLIEMMKRG